MARRVAGVRLATTMMGEMLEALEGRVLLSGSIPTVPVPAAYYAFDESAGTSAADSSGNGHAGTLGAGASWVTGNVGTHAVKFNGSASGLVTVSGPVIDTSASFTVSAWVNLASLSGYQTFASISGNSVSGFYLQLRGDTGTFGFTRIGSDSTGASTVVTSPSAPSLNTWYHVVGVSDATAGTISLYVDGTLIGTSAFTGNWAATGDTLIGHGKYNGSLVDFVNGAEDDVKFFSSALSADQVAALDTPASYPFNEGSGTTAADYSGHGNTATLGATASWGAGYTGTNSLSVNGTATSVATTAGPVIDTSLPFSVSTWVKLNTVSGTQTFASIDGVNASGFALQLRADTGKFAFTRLSADSNAATATHADGIATPVAGTWYNLIGVNDVANGKLLLYVNGALQASVTYTGGWQAAGATVIGAGKANGARTDFANALIDDARFYNAALNSSVAAYIGTGGNSILNITPAVTGVTVSQKLFGAFMEDINYGGEGGIYSNEVRNSGFNDSTNALNAWTTVSGSGVSLTLSSDATTGPTSALTSSGKLTITSGVSGSARAGIANTGYFGVAVAPNTTYTGFFYAKATAGFTGPLTVALESTTGTVYATATISSITTSWAKYTFSMTTSAGTPVSTTNRFVIYTTSASANADSIWFGATYLYPPAYNNAPSHLRVDLMQKLAALAPAIFRVPGGNYLEGNTYADRFNWSTTIGPVENRPGHYNSAWGYWSTDAMGLDEYLQMAELVGAQPILAVYAGYTLNGSSDTGTTLTNDVTDAVNELHYCLDPVTTSWGAMRAANGHAAPYNINYVEVGNEDWFSSTYATRYPLFYNAIHAAFPSLQIIATSTSTGGSPYDVIDDHYYNSPSWFLANSNHYDSTSRSGAKVFVGEYAARDGGAVGSLLAGLGDAAWLMGLERNSDLVQMSSYAPLWVNVNSYQWNTNLIGFDGSSSFGSPSYWAQTMLNNNKGSVVVSSSLAGASGLQALVTRTGSTYYVTVVNSSATSNNTTLNLAGITHTSATGTQIVLTGSASNVTNSIANPTNVVPVTSTFSGLAPSFSYSFAPYSLTILTFTADADPPTVATAAAATPSTVAGTTTALSVLGADTSGESNLTYTWATTGNPPAAVNFSANGTNASKNTIATFSKAGTYNFVVTIMNVAGLAVTSNVSVTVNQMLTGITILPGSTTVVPGGTSQLAVYATDQFGTPMGSAGSITWSIVAGTGGVNASGLFTAAANGSGVTTIRALTSAGKAAYADITTLAQVAWYQANASSGSTLADTSNNANDATLTGNAAFGGGVSGNALALTGGYASLPTGIVSSLTSFTIATWVKVTSLNQWSRIFDFGTGATTNMFLTPYSGNNTIRFAITTGGGAGEQRLNAPVIAVNTWTHIAVTIVPGTGNLYTGTLYINGVAIDTNANMTLTASSLGNTTQNYLGKSQYNDPALQGSIDDFRIIARGLTAAEVLRLAQPTFLQAPAALSNPGSMAGVRMTTLGSDETAGETSLVYTWSLAGTNPGTASFSINGTNAAKNTTASFSAPGTYTLQVSTANPAAGLTVTSSTFTVTVNLTGDANDDGHVDLADYDLWYRNVGTVNATSVTVGDFNGDGLVDLADYDVWYAHVGTTAALSASQAVTTATSTSASTAAPTLASGSISTIPSSETLAVAVSSATQPPGKSGSMSSLAVVLAHSALAVPAPALPSPLKQGIVEHPWFDATLNAQGIRRHPRPNPLDSSGSTLASALASE